MHSASSSGGIAQIGRGIANTPEAPLSLPACPSMMLVILQAMRGRREQRVWDDELGQWVLRLQVKGGRKRVEAKAFQWLIALVVGISALRGGRYPAQKLCMRFPTQVDLS